MKQPLFRAREARAPLTVLLCSVVGVMAMGSQAKAADLSGNAAITTDYVWRGSTQTASDPAVQAGFKITADSGLYASAWGSNVKFAPGSDASNELDVALGWGKALGDDWAIDVNILHYQYPSTSTNLDWTELNGTLTYKGNYWASVGYSNEALGYDADGVYAQLGARFPINDRLRVEAIVAHYLLDNAVVARNGYTHGALSAVWTVKGPVEARLTVHGTDGNAKAIFGDDFAGSRVEAALQASF